MLHSSLPPVKFLLSIAEEIKVTLGVERSMSLLKRVGIVFVSF